MNKTLTAADRATIMDACQSISRSADALKAGCSIDGEWPDADDKAFYDAELRLLGRLTALLAAQQPEPQCTCDMRTRVLGDGCEVCQPEPRAEVTGWQPIETAPKDGTPLVMFARYVHATASIVVVASWLENYGMWVNQSFSCAPVQQVVPSHWMARPEFPIDAALAQRQGEDHV